MIYRDDGSKASQVEPYTTFPPLGSDDPRDLWKWMAAYEEKTGGRLLAISHNGNLSNGRMFPIIEPVSGGKLDKEYAQTRMKWERLYEVTQTKGDSETHPFLSPNDEFADFNRWDRSNLDGSVRKKQEMLEFEYARSAFKNGLKLEAELGANPFKFGLVGSTDAHNSLSAVEEDNFFGKMVTAEPNPQRWEHPFIENAKSGVTIMGWETQAAGYAAVWAQENTRESIFDAMQRRETYATTGPRMAVRLFGGWEFEAKDAESRSPAVIGYSKGVPMGGDLTAAPAGKAPTFLVAALRDPIGANLDRYQIVKGWLDAKGELHERIYDVAVSGGRPIGADGRCKVVGRQHGGRGERHVEQHHRRAGVDRGVEGPGLRREATRLLLRSRDRDSDAALDGLRREAFRREDAEGSPDDDDRARLHLADPWPRSPTRAGPASRA